MAPLTSCDCEGWCADCLRRQYERERMQRYRANGPSDPTVSLESLPPPGDWIRNARCKTAPVNVFFPERGDDVRPAKAICARCPVLDDCRTYALDAPQQLQGVWGGMSANERRNARIGRVA